MRVILRDQAKRARGTWSLISYPSGRRSALFICPDCGAPIALSAHTIHPEGTVEPAVRCAHAGCGFREILRLSGWTRPEA